MTLHNFLIALPIFIIAAALWLGASLYDRRTR